MCGSESCQLKTSSATIDENAVKITSSLQNTFYRAEILDILDMSPDGILWPAVVDTFRVEVGTSRFTAVCHVAFLVHMEAV